MTNRTILVTGASGFVGRRMFQSLKSLGMPALGSDLVASVDSPVMQSDYEFLDFKDIPNRSLSVIHIAARNNIRESYNNPEIYFEDNFHKFVRFYTKNKHKIEKLIYISSCSVYMANADKPIPVNYPVQPTSPYSLSKHYLEQYIINECRAEGINCACFRAFNIVGSAQISSVNSTTADRIFPSIAKSIQTHSVFNVFGSDYPTNDGTCVHDYIHVDDLIELLMLALNPSYEGVGLYNAGTSIGVSILAVLRDIERHTGKQIPFSLSGRRPGDVAYRVADISETTDTFGWKPRTTWDNIVGEFCRAIKL